jgi:hypothetical protein
MGSKKQRTTSAARATIEASLQIALELAQVQANTTKNTFVKNDKSSPAPAQVVSK